SMATVARHQETSPAALAVLSSSSAAAAAMDASSSSSRIWMNRSISIKSSCRQAYTYRRAKWREIDANRGEISHSGYRSRIVELVPPDLAFGAFTEHGPWVIDPDRLVWRDGID